MNRTIALLAALLLAPPAAVRAADAAPPWPQKVEANVVAEIALLSDKTYHSPFMEVELHALLTQPDGSQLRVPAFWAGGSRWCFRYASSKTGRVAWRTECSDRGNPKLHGVEGKIEVAAYAGSNALYRHGPIRVAADRRHFEHADGTPFFWLGDAWWKGLCKRLTWEGFQELTADRRTKGFTLVQVVCGPYPDEGLFEPRWENEGGKPYGARDFSVANPAYFGHADRRIRHLVDSGLVPAVVGGWGRGGSLEAVGLAGYKRHWRNLVARYGAYPIVWIIGGEAGGKQWTEVARYVQQTDPYRRPATMHPFQSARQAVTDETVIAFDMLQTGHGDWGVAVGAVPKLKAAYSRTPVMPVLVGECCYEAHMQTAFQDAQRYMFWGCMLSGAAGHTYGAAGVWHASVEGEPGITPVYDWTTWKEGMSYPGCIQLGLGKKLLERYQWWRFEPHPEWAEEGCFAAGIPGEVRVIYLPKRGVYNWNGPRLRNLERDVPYSAFYFNPASGKEHKLGTILNAGPPPKPFEGHSQPRLFEDRFDGADASAWKDHGSPSQRKGGRLVGTKGMVTILEKVAEADLMASADAKSDAEAGIILRFHDADNYLVALYTPSLKAIYLHDRRNGQWGEPLGRVAVPEIGPEIRLTAAACGEYAAMVLTDGKRAFSTPTVKVNNVTSGKVGVWLFQIGERQHYGNFEVSRAKFAPVKHGAKGQAHLLLSSDEDKAPPVPSPQDWVLVLERVKP
ncbi:MAG: DUF4038 domain-containing protein [Planctomycetes bacterium]|nr:DUF4038 domain-containing protein [Planctomycetota bacterium]